VYVREWTLGPSVGCHPDEGLIRLRGKEDNGGCVRVRSLRVCARDSGEGGCACVLKKGR